MRKVHASLDVTEDDFNVIVKHLQKTLEELKVEKALVGEVMAVIATTKEAVLNRAKLEAETEPVENQSSERPGIAFPQANHYTPNLE
ncbi:MAG: hypothetical protein ACI8T1_005503 [Verrucomicrobiales bacterium]|jgi:hypothetical protein